MEAISVTVEAFMDEIDRLIEHYHFTRLIAVSKPRILTHTARAFLKDPGYRNRNTTFIKEVLITQPPTRVVGWEQHSEKGTFKIIMIKHKIVETMIHSQLTHIYILIHI